MLFVSSLWGVVGLLEREWRGKTLTNTVKLLENLREKERERYSCYKSYPILMEIWKNGSAKVDSFGEYLREFLRDYEIALTHSNYNKEREREPS
jgi:hypothetical protein